MNITCLFSELSRINIARVGASKVHERYILVVSPSETIKKKAPIPSVVFSELPCIVRPSSNCNDGNVKPCRQCFCH